MKKLESSKKIIIVCYVILIAVLIATYAAVFLYREVTGLEQIVLAIIGLVASANGFYFWKARAENTLKISKDVGLKQAKEIARDADLEIEYFSKGDDDNGQFNV